jgi:hypothetical protein
LLTVQAGGESTRARAWASGPKNRADSLWPRFDGNMIVRALRGAPPALDERKAIRCPTLIVRAERGMDEAEARRMAASLEGALAVTVPAAGA